MYEEYWGLSEKPFRNTPDPKFLYFSPQHHDALAKLTYCAKEALGAAMLTGVFGCGKTVIANALLQELNPEKYRIAFIAHPLSGWAENLVAIAMSLGDKDLINKSHQTNFIESFALESLKNILSNNHADGKDTIVIIDEAHLLDDPKIFEQMRLLLNFQLMDKFLLNLILIGQTELRQKIDNFKQFEQRIAIKSHLDALNQEETKNYINHRLNVAGRKEPIFTDEALALIYEYTGGIPRRINRICDLSLLAGFTHKVIKIDIGIIQAQTSLLGVEVSRQAKDRQLVFPQQEMLKSQPIKIEKDEKGTEQFYRNGLILCENIFSRTEKNEPLDYTVINLLVEQLIDGLKAGDYNLIKLANNFNTENYLYAHILNVTILSIIVGLGLGYDRQRLINLGTGALLHDLGLVKSKDIISKPNKLEPNEYKEIKKHPINSKKLLEEIKDISDEVKNIALYHHERMNGEGYPEGLESEQIPDLVKVVSICDVFEALIHDRPWRIGINPYEAMKIIKDGTGKLFDKDIVKILVEKISVYPVGSLVELNTQEKAEVVKVECGFPRLMKILCDSSGNRLEKPRLVDLFEYPNLYIEKAITKKEGLTKSDTSFTPNTKEREL